MTHSIVSVCLSVILYGMAGNALPPSTQDNETFAQANEAYNQGAFSDAIAGFEKLRSAGHHGGWIDYNLGNSYLRAGNLGHAIAALRRSQAALPRDGDVKANLAFARRSVQDAIAPAEPAVLWRTLFFWNFGLSVGEQAIGCVIFNALMWGLLIARLYRPQSEALRWAAGVSILGTIAVAGALVWHEGIAPAAAVVAKPEIEVHSGTRRDTAVRFKLHEGVETLVVDRDADWLRVELSDGKQGWVAAGDVEVI